MKNLMTFFALLFCFAMHAQNFEGTIKWSMNMEITDPETKAKMEEAQRKMQDPATQAKMKEFKAKMSDPEFKKMMEQNPQMKSQMEAAMKMMDGGGMNSLLPKAIELRIKNQNTLTRFDGGAMTNMETLYLKDKDKSYHVDRQAKTYSVMSTKTPGATSTSDVESKVTKTSETQKILGYNCTKYLVEATIKGQKFNHFIWATTDIKNIDIRSLAKQHYQNGQTFSYEKIDGVPLKMEMFSKEGKMTMEAISFKEQSQPAADFIIPADFKEVPAPFGF